jgi:peptide/nickel transport system permease protein
MAVISDLGSSPAEFSTGQSLPAFSWVRLVRQKMTLLGGGVLLVVILMVCFAPFLSPYSSSEQNLRARLQPPSASHWLGTDDLGRDLLTRLLYGGRISLAVGFLAMGMALFTGTLVGLLSGYFGGWVDAVLMRMTEIFLSVPRLFVLLALATLLRQLNLANMRAGSFLPIAVVIGALAWMGTARQVRAAALELRGQEFVQASLALGASNARLLLHHILPNAMSPIIVSATLGLAGALISESGLSYLGLGVQLPTPTWGNMLSSAQSQMTTAPWTALFPGLMIFLVVIAANALGDGLREAFDPRSN